VTADVLDRVRAFTARELTGQHDRLDIPGALPLEISRRFHAAGLALWWLPEPDGGLGASIEQSVDVVSELAYGDAGIAFTFLVPLTGTLLVSLYGSPDLYKQHVLPMAASGGCCALAFSEHEAGSELDRTATLAEHRGAEILLNGTKAFSTNADFADFLLVLARDAASDADASSFHTLLVPRNSPGLQVDKRWPVIGLRASATYQLSFNDCRIPAENALNGPGIRVLEAGVNSARILIGAMALGIARRIRDLCMDYAATKPLAGTGLLDNPVFAAKLGQMEMEIDVMRNQCRGTLRSALGAKMFCGQTGWQIATVGSQIFGGLGYTTTLPMAKLLRDIRLVSIGDGGDDVLRQLLYNRYVLPAFRRV